MRRKLIFRIFWICWTVLLVVACSDPWEGEGNNDNDKEGLPLALSISGRAADNGLKYDLYVFRKEGAEDDYKLEQVLPLKADGQDRIRLSNDELRSSAYRFLFLATPENAPEIAVKGTDGNVPVVGSFSWRDLTVTAEKDSLTAENYYCILDREGTELLKAGNIDGILTRLVGQMVFEFYRVGPDGISKPVEIVSPDVLSVLDRVYRIDLSYTGLAQTVRFGTGNMPEAVSPAGGAVERHISLQTDTALRVGIPQGILESLPERGAVRLKGEYVLPSDATVRVKMEFRYYDTTPKCGEPEEQHDVSCYQQNSLVLNLPAVTNGTGLSVIADHFTVNKGGIHYDRVIDLGHTTDMTLDTEWKNTFK